MRNGGDPAFACLLPATPPGAASGPAPSVSFRAFRGPSSVSEPRETPPAPRECLLGKALRLSAKAAQARFQSVATFSGHASALSVSALMTEPQKAVAVSQKAASGLTTAASPASKINAALKYVFPFLLKADTLRQASRFRDSQAALFPSLPCAYHCPAMPPVGEAPSHNDQGPNNLQRTMTKGQTAHMRAAQVGEAPNHHVQGPNKLQRTMTKGQTAHVRAAFGAWPLVPGAYLALGHCSLVLSAWRTNPRRPTLTRPCPIRSPHAGIKSAGTNLPGPGLPRGRRFRHRPFRLKTSPSTR